LETRYLSNHKKGQTERKLIISHLRICPLSSVLCNVLYLTPLVERFSIEIIIISSYNQLLISNTIRWEQARSLPYNTFTTTAAAAHIVCNHTVSIFRIYFLKDTPKEFPKSWVRYQKQTSILVIIPTKNQ